ncbi:hypothetical protein WNY63_13765 [Pseudoalteromonas neustonica]|uniref:YqaE/Pmp3 family membrane protein n=1 Tax=Pseudoalteromonas neustonica TaxID=1840331 RepID=A0ABU9U422_9GAMM
MNFFKRVIGYVLFLPFIGFYSCMLGPLLKGILIPGGLIMLWLILGPKEGYLALKKAFITK